MAWKSFEVTMVSQQYGVLRVRARTAGEAMQKAEERASDAEYLDGTDFEPLSARELVGDHRDLFTVEN